MIFPPFGSLSSSSRRKKARKVPGMVIDFLYVLALTSNNWRFKQAPGDIFGLMFACINERDRSLPGLFLL
jgi:hypothetical protein